MVRLLKSMFKVFKFIYKIFKFDGTVFQHSLEYNPHLDGLRGIAILLVILFHFFPFRFSFGFIGVDIFFVLSGYLITSIIITKSNKNTFSFKEFYRNRARRLFPALILVLSFSLIIGYFFLLPEEFMNLGKHIKSSALYYQNFRLIDEVGYWNKEAIYKPLLHIWSLSIEEQFYFIWPLLIFFLYKKNKLNLKTFLLIESLLFSLSIFLFLKYPNEKVFYHTLSRSWELGIGGLVAFIIFSKKFEFYRILNLSKFSFFFFILILVLFYKVQVYNPIKVLFLAVVIALWIIKVNFYTDKILSNRFLIAIGLISYSLYLWHYVLLSFAYIFGYFELKFRVFILILSFILSYLTYKLIEVPFRKKDSYRLSIYLLLFLLFLAFMGNYISKNNIENRPIIKSIKEDLKNMQRDDPNNQYCLNLTKKILNRLPRFDYCKSTTDDNSKIKIVLIGDSHAEVLFYGLKKILQTDNTNLLLLANSGCPPYISGAIARNTEEIKLCKEKITDIYDILNNLTDVKVVIISTRIAVYASGIGFGDVEKDFMLNPLRFEEFFLYQDKNYNQEKIFFKKIEKTLKYISNKGFKIIYVLENPELGFNPKTCLNRLFIPSGYNCKLNRGNYIKRQQRYRKIIENLAKNYKNVKILDPEDIFCDDSYCYLYKDGKILYSDDDHVSKYGSFLIAKKIRSLLNIRE